MSEQSQPAFEEHPTGQLKEMVSPEEARACVLAHVKLLESERVSIIDAIGRVCAQDVVSDIDIAPFAHAAMDGYALHAADIAEASEEHPVVLNVLGEVGAGDVFPDAIPAGSCVRIMTGACVPEDVDAVVKFEIVKAYPQTSLADGTAEFSAPTTLRSNIREAGEEAHAGECVMHAGEMIHAAGVGFLASCGAAEVSVYRRPRVGIIATGSELVDPLSVPGPGKIRNSNSYAMAACAVSAGAVPHVYPICEDTKEALTKAVHTACAECDFVVTTGGAANGDYDFIKKVIAEEGTLYMTTVNMRPGKAQSFGLVDDTPVFGLPGNPAAAYVGFELLIRPALRKMQGFTHFDHVRLTAKLSKDVKKKDPRRIYLRATLTRNEAGELIATPAKNQSSGSFGVIQQSNCLAIMPEGKTPKSAGDEITCLILDIPEELVL